MRVPGRRDQAGFTLAELLIVIVLIGVIAAPLIDAFIQGLDATGRAGTSLGSSHDAQLTDYYLERDAIGSSVSTAGTSPAAGWTCALADPSISVSMAASEGVVEFNWTQAPVYTPTALPSGLPDFVPGNSYEADYLYQGSSLTRYYCTVSGTTGSTPQVTKVASGLSQTVAPTVSINGGCAGSKTKATCTTVQLTDPNGTVYSAVLYQRTSR